MCEVSWVSLLLEARGTVTTGAPLLPLLFDSVTLDVYNSMNSLILKQFADEGLPIQLANLGG